MEGVFPRMLCNPISSFMNWRDLTGWIESFNWMFDEIEGGGVGGLDIKGNFIFSVSSPPFYSRIRDLFFDTKSERWLLKRNFKK